MPAPVEVVRLRQAIEAFGERPPRNLPDGVMDGLKEVQDMLASIEPERESPGHDAAKEVSPTTGTGVHFSKAARGTDVPSPGQRAASRLSEEMLEQASLRDKLG